MSINPLNHFISKLSGKIPLRIVIIIPFVIQIFAVVGLTGWLSFRNGQQAVDDLATQLRSEIATRIYQHLETHIRMPHVANQVNKESINLKQLNLTDTNSLEQHLWRQIQHFDFVSYIGIGTEKAKYVGAQLFANGTTLIEVMDQTTNGHLEIWETDEFANRTKLKQTIPNYEFKNRPWYANAVKEEKAVWSKAYFSSRRITLAANKPIYNDQGNLLAVATADINVLNISHFLRSLKVGKTGQSFIIERSGFLVATSTSEKPYRKTVQDTSTTAFKATNSTNALTRNTAHFLTQYFGDLNLIKTPRYLSFKNNNDHYFLQIMPFQDSRGLDWLIVVVAPEADFMERIDANMYYTILLCLVALMVTILVGFLTAKWIIHPLLRLNTTAKALAKSEWQITGEVERQDEVGELAKSFNRLTKQLQDSFTTLETKNAELQQLDRLKDEFLANTSHELRTPLNGMIGIAESLIDGVTGKLSSATCDELVMIVTSGRRLSNLINDILDFSKQKHKKIELQLKSLDMQKITTAVLKLCQPLIGNKKLQLINAIHSDIPLISGDENRIQQVLYNLVGNAIKFTQTGHIKISAQLSQTEKLKSELAITISDTGIGIPPNQTSQIFELFGQGSDSATVQPSGGLGLTVTKQLVALHGGEIWVKSVVGVGSSFTFTLPNNAELLLDKQTPAQPALIETKLQEGLQKALPQNPTESLIEDSAIPLPQNLLPSKQETFTILIVDDEPVNLHVLTNHLSLHNYTIVEAASGLEALDIINKNDIPDLILLDVMMPRMTGYEVAQKIRKTWEASELPILLLTAKNQVTDLVKGFESGANDYLMKPISRHELLARIKTHLHVVQLHRELEEYSHTLEQKVDERTRKLAESEAILADAQRMALLGSWVWDIQANTVIRSAQDCRNFKQKPTNYEPTYEAFIENIHPDDKEIIHSMVGRKIKEGHTAEFEFRAIWPNNQIRVMRSRTELEFDESDKPIRMKGFTQDITERKEVEVKLQEAKQAAERALQQLKATQDQLVETAKMAELGNLVAGVAHEINTPVGIGVSAASKLETLTKEISYLYENHKMKRADLEKYLTSSRKGSELLLKNLSRAAELVHSFKQVAVDQAGEQKRTFEIKDYLNEILTTLRPEFKRTKPKVSVICEEEIVLSSYPGAFAQLITNLIMNSMIHGFASLPPENGKKEWQINLVVTTSQSTENELDKNLNLRYSDNGKGIPTDIISNIFDPFFTTNRQGGGSGLGLHIVYNLVTHKLKGTIKCESVEGEGTTFNISIPILA